MDLHQLTPEKKSNTFPTVTLTVSEKASHQLSTKEPMISPVNLFLNPDETVAIKAIDMKGVKDSISREMLDCEI